MVTTESVAAARIREFIEVATQQFHQELSRVVGEHDLAGRRVNELLGEPRAFARRAVRAAVPLASPWDELIGPFVRSEGVQSRLGISRQAVAAKAARRRVVRVITLEDDHLYPLWQFDGDQVVPGLAEIVSMFPEAAVDGWTLAAWLRAPDPDLGESPFETIARGDLTTARAVARTAARAITA